MADAREASAGLEALAEALGTLRGSVAARRAMSMERRAKIQHELDKCVAWEEQLDAEEAALERAMAAHAALGTVPHAPDAEAWSAGMFADSPESEGRRGLEGKRIKFGSRRAAVLSFVAEECSGPSGPPRTEDVIRALASATAHRMGPSNIREQLRYEEMARTLRIEGGRWTVTEFGAGQFAVWGAREEAKRHARPPRQERAAARTDGAEGAATQGPLL